MSGSLNKVILIGNLGRDPETRTFPSGDKVASFSVATSESWKDKATGEKKERTEWHNVEVFGPLAGVVELYLRKGSKVFLEGALQTQKWTDKKTGAEKYTTKVILSGLSAKMVLLDKKDSTAEKPSGPPSSGGWDSGDGLGCFDPTPSAGAGSFEDDDIPY